MPSTKKRKSTRRSELATLEKKFELDFKRKSALELKKLEKDLKDEMNKLLCKIDIEFAKFPPEIQNMTLGDIRKLLDSEDIEEESFTPPRPPERNTTNLSDNGYVSDKPLSKSNTSSFAKGKAKVGPKSSKNKLDKMQLALPKANIYSHTPNNKEMNKVVPITPKICPNTPLNVLRQPRCGETVESMTGSPILVSTVLQEERMANLMLPLNNGDVISLLPTGSLRQSLLPTLSPSTVEQLKTLKDHIEKFIPKEK